jgi:hypothetical protein
MRIKFFSTCRSDLHHRRRIHLPRCLQRCLPHSSAALFAALPAALPAA